MGIGLSGMISGLDTDAIVKAMVSAQQTKATKIENKITLNKWTTEAWSSLNTKIYSFYTKYASKLRLQSSYMTRSASSSNESIVKATAGSTAAVGTHSLQIKQLASSQYVTGAKLSGTYNKNTKLSELGNGGVPVGTILTITGKKGTADETVKKLEVTEQTTVSDFLNACKDAGLTATFDETQQRFFISSSESGKNDAFSITTSELSETAGNVFATLQDSIDTSLLSATEKTKYDEAMATLRQNVDLIDDVLSANYDSTNKTQKAVMDAIDVIKNAAETTYAHETAVKEEDQKLDDALDASAADPSAKIAYGSTEYTFDTLFTVAEGKIEEALKKAAAAEGKKAVENLNLGDLGVGYVDPATLTQESVAEAQALIDAAKDENGNPLYTTVADVDAALAALETDTTLSEEDKKKQTDELNAIKDAFAKVNTWNYQVTEQEVDADGNPVFDANGDPVMKVIGTIGSVYTNAYDTDYAAGKNAADYDDKIAAEMRATLLAEQKTAYNDGISNRQAEILAAEDTEDAKQLKSDIEASLTGAATAGTNEKADALAAMGLGQITGADVKNTDASGDSVGMVVVAASDAKIVLDGATMEESSNSFTVNGLTLNLASTTLNKETGDYDTVQVTVGKDTDSTFNLVKEAITEYNKLIEEMNKLYNADSARGYDPLTDEQKEAMSETDIENWEGKIKGALLRRDDTLGSLLSSMRTALASTYKDEETGKTFSLSTFGIVTGNYTENGKLHIYGDTDDATYATYEDRLKKALEEDPDQVMTVLTSVFGKLYETMSEKCAKTEISSALTFYNDKQYSKLLDGYEDDLETMEDRIKEMEDKYYKQFTAMEKALSKLQSQTNSLASLLGTNTQQ